MCCTLSSKELNELPGTCAAEDAPVPAERASGNERPRKKKGVRPPTLELERYLPEEVDWHAVLGKLQAGVDMSKPNPEVPYWEDVFFLL